MVSLQNRQTIIAFATLAASIMLVRRIASAFVPSGVQRYFSNLHSFSSHFSTQLLTVVVEKDQRPEFNQLFQAADFYWGTLVTSSIIRGREAEEETAVDKDLEILDVFRNVKIRWKLVFTEVEQFDIEKINTTMQSGRRAYELTFHKEHKDTVLNLYLAYVLEQEKAIKEERRVQRFQKFRNRRWELDATFEHTTNFKTLVMEPQLKKILLDDLNTFMSAQEKYRRIGKAWNRRYLLCGPPGTGKSDLIAAMANHLNYDIYKLDRTDFNIHYIMHHEVPSKSILVFKDIDCDVELLDQEYENGPENYDEHKVRTSTRKVFI
jgi:chaperone BCS1